MLKNYNRTDNNYEATYEITLWDHFGLDLNDIRKFNFWAGFRAWFILQHLRGYKPFITKVQFEKTFTGNINEGKTERENKRKAEERKKTNQWAE
jgi:hypothetical protein